MKLKINEWKFLNRNQIKVIGNDDISKPEWKINELISKIINETFKEILIKYITSEIFKLK